VSNQSYDQVNDLVADGTLRWQTDQIVALLVQNASFTASHTKLSQLGVNPVTTAPINGRWIAEGGLGMGQPAVFQKVNTGQEFQVLIAKGEGRGDPLVLAFMDEDTEGNPIVVTRTGTLIVRPSQENIPTTPDVMELPPNTGFWLKL
jgi:hypothetical protein